MSLKMIVDKPDLVSISHNYKNNNQVKLIFCEKTPLTQYTFPRVEELREIFHEEDINRALNIVKNRIISNRNNNNENNCRMNNSDFTLLTQKIVNEVKDILRRLGYIIVEIEDQNNVSMGWKIYY